jgi:hypothetical protein
MLSFVNVMVVNKDDRIVKSQIAQKKREVRSGVVFDMEEDIVAKQMLTFSMIFHPLPDSLLKGNVCAGVALLCYFHTNPSARSRRNTLSYAKLIDVFRS